MWMQLISSSTSGKQRRRWRERLSSPPLRMIHHLRVHAPLRLRSPLRYCHRGAVGSENCVILNPQLDSVLCSCVREKKNLPRSSLFISSLIRSSGETSVAPLDNNTVDAEETGNPFSALPVCYNTPHTQLSNCGEPGPHDRNL